MSSTCSGTKAILTFLKKCTAFFVLLSFSLLNTTNQAYGMTVQENEPPNQAGHRLIPKEVIESLWLPEELGTVSETYLPEAGEVEKLVIYVESAHTNYDSESKTEKLIELFQKEYALPLVLLEGGSGKLDSLFFKSFPDQKLKEKTLTEYLHKRDLSGGEVASILDHDSQTQYYGIEDWELYQENKQAFLEALKQQDEILNQLNEIESHLLKSAAVFFSEPTKRFYEQSTAFQREEIDLIQYLKGLEALWRQTQTVRSASFHATYPELEKLLKADSGEKRLKTTDIDIATNRMVEAFQKEIVPKLPRSAQMKANHLIQSYRIGELSSGLLTERIKSLAQEQNFSFEPPKELIPAQEQAQTLSSIRGTKLFKELKSLEADLRASLPQSDQEQALLEDFHHLDLLRTFARLELEREDWETLRNKKPSGILTALTTISGPQRRSSLRGSRPGRSLARHCEARRAEATSQARDRLCNLESEIASTLHEVFSRNDDAFDDLFAFHYRFYTLAKQRDHVLLNNAVSLTDEHKANLALIAAGGFHKHGITQALKEKKIPYLIITPRISHLDNRENYFNVIRGNRSFMKDFSGNLWDALAQDYTTKISESLNPFDRAHSLKRWRDQIIQHSFAEGRITEAYQYTKYIDALAKSLRE